MTHPAGEASQNATAVAVRKWASRLYGTLAVLLGALVLVFGVAALMACGRTELSGLLAALIDDPKTVSALVGPYYLVLGSALVALGVWACRQSVPAAIGLLVLVIIATILDLFPALSIDGDDDASLDVTDVLAIVASAALTGAVIWADRAMRRPT